MSLVQAVITDKFVLVGAETRGINPNGTMVDNCNKLIKLNDQIIFGCTGGIFENYTLFNGFCNLHGEIGLVPITNNIDISYNDFVAIISQRFKEMYKLRNREINPISYAIMSMICGYNGLEFEATLFNIDADENNCIIKATKPLNFPYKGINAGKAFHLDNMSDFIQDIYFKYGDMTLLQCKNALKNTFEKGMMIDDQINCNMHFESIRIWDVR